MSSVGAIVSAAALLLPCAVQALPQYYAQQYDGCEVPQKAYGNHGAPKLDDTIEFEIWQNSRDNTVSEWEPEEVYNITVPMYESNEGPNQMNMWLWVQDGTLRRGAGNLASCGAAWYSQAIAGSHTIEWTAPPRGNKVQIQVAQAAGQTDYYHIGQTNFRAVPPPPMPAPSEAPESEPAARGTAPAPATDTAAQTGSDASPSPMMDSAGELLTGAAALGAVALSTLLL